MPEMSLLDLPSVSFETPRLLPQCTAIYFCLSTECDVLYIGSSWNIRRRWYQHEKQTLLASIGCTIIAWLACTLEQIVALETDCIRAFRPMLNLKDSARNTSRSPMIERQCRFCNRSFKFPSASIAGQHRGRGSYCSMDCYNKSKPIPRLLGECQYCHAPMQYRQSRLKYGDGKYCSLPCSAKGIGVLHKQRSEQRMLSRIQKCQHLPFCIYCCWTYSGLHDKDGYPKYGNRRIHRIIWEIHNQQSLINLDRKLIIRHLCSHAGCINPWHLSIGTYKQNTQDTRKAGHLPFGEKHYRTKFSVEDIIAIRQCEKDGVAAKETANLFQCSISNIRHIWARRCWKHVP